MMLSTYFLLICLLIYNGLSASVLQNTATRPKGGLIDFKGLSFEDRQKRSLVKFILSRVAVTKSKRARDLLIGGLKPVGKLRLVTFYEKKGNDLDIQRAFQSVKPTDVRDFVLNGKKIGETGKIGDGTISYATRGANGIARLLIVRPNQNGEKATDVITYYQGALY